MVTRCYGGYKLGAHSMIKHISIAITPELKIIRKTSEVASSSCNRVPWPEWCCSNIVCSPLLIRTVGIILPGIRYIVGNVVQLIRLWVQMDSRDERLARVSPFTAEAALLQRPSVCNNLVRVPFAFTYANPNRAMLLDCFA